MPSQNALYAYALLPICIDPASMCRGPHAVCCNVSWLCTFYACTEFVLELCNSLERQLNMDVNACQHITPVVGFCAKIMPATAQTQACTPARHVPGLCVSGHSANPHAVLLHRCGA